MALSPAPFRTGTVAKGEGEVTAKRQQAAARTAPVNLPGPGPPDPDAATPAPQACCFWLVSGLGDPILSPREGPAGLCSDRPLTLVCERSSPRVDSATKLNVSLQSTLLLSSLSSLWVSKP